MAINYTCTIIILSISATCIKIIKDWMLAIVIAGIVTVELLVLMIGISVPESRLQPVPTLKFEELRQNVGQYLHYSYFSMNNCMSAGESNQRTSLYLYLREQESRHLDFHLICIQSLASTLRNFYGVYDKKSQHERVK